MTMSDQIIQVLDALCEKFGIVIDWTSTNVIPYLTTLMGKLVQWEIWSSVAWIVISVIGGIAILVIVSRQSVRTLMEEGDIECVLLSIVLGFGSIACLAGIIINSMDIIKCCTFPEMFVFEYVQNLINGAS